MRRLLLGLLAATALTGLAEAQTLKIGLRQDPDILDPTLGSSYVGRIVYAAMCDKLFDLDTDLNITPQLATGYRYEDPTHLVITLRPGVTFHDGEKLDAEAVKYKLTRDLTAKGSMRAGEINAIQAIEVIDPLTIRLVLKAPASPLLAQLTDRAGIMISPKATEAAGAAFGQKPVCAGPYAFVERVAQDHITLKRHGGYWNPSEYHFDQVIYSSIPNSAVRVANLRAGSLDLVEYILPTDIEAIRKDPALRIAMTNSLAYTGITFNTGNGPAAKSVAGQNPLVRRAFELAIDKKALVDVVFNGAFSPTAQANPPSSPMYVKEIVSPTRDVARAQALLKQAGVALPVTIVLTATNEPDSQQAAEVIQSMTREAGFDVKIRTMEFAASRTAGYGGDFEAYLIGWSGRSDADGNMWQMLHTGGTFNYGRYSHPTVDALLDEARTFGDAAKRREIYAKVWQQEREDLPLVYLWNPQNIVGMKASLTGFRQVPDGLIRLRGLKPAG